MIASGAVCSLVFAVALKTQADSVWPALRPTAVFIQQKTWWMWPIATAMMFLAKAADKKFCDRWGFDAVKEMLELLRETAFPKNADPQHHHRVTLFRHKEWRLCWRTWPWSGWLIPIVRSGHTTQNRKTCFLAPDDADRAEGVVGRAWNSSRVIVIPDPEEKQSPLPALHGDSNRPLDIQPLACSYAKATFVSVDWVLKNMPYARSFMGIPVIVKGKPWGVIVVDSRAETIPNVKAVYDAYNLISRPLIKCIERLQ